VLVALGLLGDCLVFALLVFLLSRSVSDDEAMLA
jgi:hypothetical protein